MPATPNRRSRAAGRLDLALPLAALAFTVLALYGAMSRLDGTPVGALGWALAPLLALLLVVRRRFPIGVLVASIGLLIGYYASGRPPIGLELPLAPAFVSAAERGRMRAAGIVAAALVIGTYALRVVLLGQRLPVLLGIQFVTTVVVLTGAIALGGLIHGTRGRRRAEAERDQLLAARREEDLRIRIGREREQVARDVHDVLGHTMVVIGMQADMALDAGAGDETSRRSLTTIRQAARSALFEIRQSLRVVAGDSAEPREPVATLDDIDDLVDRVRETGIEVESTVVGAPRTVPITVQASAYRIAQESLTNVLRHSDATRVAITRTWLPDRLILEIADNGSLRTDPAPGSGLRGMSDRASMIGGRAVARFEAGRGFVVTAELPVPGSES